MKYIIGFLVAVGLLAGATQAYGAFSPSGGGTYRLGSSVGTSNATIKLSSFKEPVSNIAYTMSYLGSDIGYGTIDPQTTRSEFVSFSGVTQNSDGSALLTGVTRGLTRTPQGVGCTASTTLAQAHPGQSIFILSDSPCLFAEYIPARTNATSSASLVFTNTVPPHYNTIGVQGNGTAFATTSEFASVAYVNAVALVSAPNASEAAKGVVELSTGLQAASSTLTDGTGASLALYSKYSTTTPATNGNWIPVTRSNSKLSQAFFDLSGETWNFSGGLWSSASTTLTCGNITTLACNLNGIPYKFPTLQSASSSVLSTNGSGTLTWNNLRVSGVSYDSTLFSFTSAGATTSAKTVAIPANTLSPNQKLRISATFSGYGAGGNNCHYGINIGTGSATTTIGYGDDDNGAVPEMVTIAGTVFATTTSAGASTMMGTAYGYPNVISQSGVRVLGKYLAINFAAQTFIDFNVYNRTATQCGLMEESIETISS